MKTRNDDANASSPFAQATDNDVAALNALWANAGMSMGAMGEFLQSAASPVRTFAMSATLSQPDRDPAPKPIADGAMPDWSWPLK